MPDIRRRVEQHNGNLSATPLTKNLSQFERWLNHDSYSPCIRIAPSFIAADCAVRLGMKGNREALYLEGSSQRYAKDTMALRVSTCVNQIRYGDPLSKVTEDSPGSDKTTMSVDSKEFIRGLPPVGELHVVR